MNTLSSVGNIQLFDWFRILLHLYRRQVKYYLISPSSGLIMSTVFYNTPVHRVWGNSVQELITGPWKEDRYIYRSIS